MKFNLDEKYVKIGIHVTIFGVILLILLFTIINIQDVADFIGQILGTFFFFNFTSYYWTYIGLSIGSIGRIIR